jgi:4-amino-4-deoxy-L-arabinose transferase-like glycosyltransferase
MGPISILIVILVIFFCGKRFPDAAPILYVALFVRIFVIILGNYFIVLPDTTGDAYWFELQAYQWSALGFPNILFSFTVWDSDFQEASLNKSIKMGGFNSSFFISFILAVLYSLTERSPMMGQSISSLLGTLSVLIAFKIAKKIWGDSAAKKTGWLVALFPTLILYSALILREVYICFFLLVTINYIVNWHRTQSLKSFFLVILCFLVGMMFHGGMFVGLIVFLIIVFLEQAKLAVIRLRNKLITINSLLFAVITLATVAFTFTNDINIPKIGQINNFEVMKKNILKKNLVTNRGGAKYPDWVIAKSASELIYKMPLRAIYFVFSPFPWEIKKTSHIIGLIDSILYVYLTYLIFLNRKAIWANPSTKTLILMLIAFVFVYGIATGNFGTGIRHRSKFAVMFIFLAAPFLPKFIFSKK